MGGGRRVAALAGACTRHAVSSRPLGKAAYAVHSPLGVHACLRRSLALDREGNGGLDGLDRRVRRSDMRLTRLHFEADRKGEDGERLFEQADGAFRITGLDIDRHADQRRAARHHIGIADEDEGRHAVLPALSPGGDGDVGADTGWISLCQGKRQGCICHGKTRLSYQYQVLTICAFLRSSSIYFFSFGFSPSLAFIRSSDLNTISAA